LDEIIATNQNILGIEFSLGAITVQVCSVGDMCKWDYKNNTATGSVKLVG